MPGRDIEPVQLSGEIFWLQVPMPQTSMVQGAVADALRSPASAAGVIPVRLLPTDDAENPGVVVAVGSRVVGLLPQGPGVVDLAEALAAHRFDGACRARVIEEGGRRRLLLDIDRAYVEASSDAP